MFLLNGTYQASIDEVTPHIETHSVWVKKYVDDGSFIIAGPKKCKSGGVILVRSMTREELDKILSEDSFIIHQVARYDIIDFDCKLLSQIVPQLANV